MKPDGQLDDREWAMVKQVFLLHPEIVGVKLFGSRAKGTHWRGSDIDLALEGALSEFDAERIGMELDELPLPFRFEVKALSQIQHPALREHIERVGVRLYP